MVDAGLHLDLNAPDETTLINWTTVINSKLDRLRCDEDFRRNPPAHAPFPPSIFHFTPLSVADNLEFNYRNSKTLFLVGAAVKVLLETLEFFRTRTRSPRRMGFSFLMPNFFFILTSLPLCSVTEQTEAGADRRSFDLSLVTCYLRMSSELSRCVASTSERNRTFYRAIKSARITGIILRMVRISECYFRVRDRGSCLRIVTVINFISFLIRLK